MIKKDLINWVASDSGATKKDSNIMISSVLNGIIDGAVNDGKVTLVGFGTFSLVKRASRIARNPQNGEPVDVPEKIVPKFKPSKKFKEVCLDADLNI